MKEKLEKTFPQLQRDHSVTQQFRAAQKIFPTIQTLVSPTTKKEEDREIVSDSNDPKLPTELQQKILHNLAPELTLLQIGALIEYAASMTLGREPLNDHQIMQSIIAGDVQYQTQQQKLAQGKEDNTWVDKVGGSHSSQQPFSSKLEEKQKEETSMGR